MEKTRPYRPKDQRFSGFLNCIAGFYLKNLIVEYGFSEFDYGENAYLLVQISESLLFPIIISIFMLIRIS